MRRVLLPLVACWMALCVTSTAVAADYVSQVAQGLDNASVYIDPSTENITADTGTDLARMLHADDSIVLVMLPESANAGIDGDLQSFAAQVAEKTGRQMIIGIAIGGTTYGYSNTGMPSNEADDKMQRAASVSTNTVETLGTFVRNVHTWQRQHPEEVASTASAKGGLPWYVWAAGIFFLSALIVFIVGRKVSTGSTINESRKRFTAPEQIRDLMAQMAHMREDVYDAQLRSTIYQCCVDIEAYFKKYSSDKQQDAVVFQHHLSNIVEVLRKYIDVQDNERYYNDPRRLLEEGDDAINSFSEFVLTSIRRGNDAELARYTVNTKILKAQRYA
jgi:hypothetical protein